MCRNNIIIDRPGPQMKMILSRFILQSHGVLTKGVQDLAMSTDFNAHLITSRQPSEECKSKVLLNLEDVFPNYEANLTPDLFRL